MTQEFQNLDQENTQIENKNWFLDLSDNWFLSKESKSILPNKDAWFVDPIKATEVIHKAGKRKKGNVKDVTIQMTKDPELLKQYYDLREREYKREWGFVEYSGQEDDFDKKSNIMVVVENGEVVAGLRVSIPDTGYLSNEEPKENFTYQEICKSCGISLEGVKYVEVSAVVVDKNFSNVLLGKMFNNVIMSCRSFGIKYIFGVSTKHCNRDYYMALKKLGVESIIVNQIQAPKKSKYNNVSMSPIIIIP